MTHLTGDELGQLAKQKVARFRAVEVLLERLAHLRVGQLGFALLNRADRGVAPGLAVVKQVPVFQGQPGRHAGGQTLSQHPPALGVMLGDALELGLVDFGKTVVDHDGVEQHRAAALRGHLGAEVDITLSAKG